MLPSADRQRTVYLRFPIFLLSLFLILNTSGVATAANSATLSDAEVQACLNVVDQSVEAYAHQDITHARDTLNEMVPTCAGFPQLHHNLGVLEALSGNWDASIEQFQLAVKSDYRAAESYEALNAIFRYRAALAYQKALNVKAKAPLPTLSMQDSLAHNADRDWQYKSTAYLHSVSTIDYELYDWWIANQDGNVAGSYYHYASEYPQPNNTTHFGSDWESVERDIAFTTNDAVVVLSYPGKETIQRTQLLLRLQGSRWKIYRETRW